MTCHSTVPAFLNKEFEGLSLHLLIADYDPCLQWGLARLHLEWKNEFSLRPT